MASEDVGGRSAGRSPSEVDGAHRSSGKAPPRSCLSRALRLASACSRAFAQGISLCHDKSCKAEDTLEE